jgi:hypothetical protein
MSANNTITFSHQVGQIAKLSSYGPVGRYNRMGIKLPLGSPVREDVSVDESRRVREETQLSKYMTEW